MSRHKHSGFIYEFSQDAQETHEPHLRWEFFDNNTWIGCDKNMQGWDESLLFRRKPETIIVNGFTIENGIEHPSVVNDHLFIANPISNDFYTENSRRCEERMTNTIKYRLIYRTKEAAIIRAKAMLGINPFE